MKTSFVRLMAAAVALSLFSAAHPAAARTGSGRAGTKTAALHPNKATARLKPAAKPSVVKKTIEIHSFGYGTYNPVTTGGKR